MEKIKKKLKTDDDLDWVDHSKTLDEQEVSPDETLVFHWDGPSFEIADMFNADKYRIAVKYADKNVLQSGLLTGESYVAGKGALVTCQKGAGEVVLYGFGPQNRAQTTGTYKLLFNMLYR